MKNKKILTGFVGLFAICLVTAGVVGYLFSQELVFNGNQVNINGEEFQEISCDIGSECYGSEVELENDLSMNALMSLTSENDVGVETKYVSELTLAQKVVDFDLDKWDLLVDGDEVVVEYTIVGDSFSAEVVEGELENYVLIYYADNDDRFANPGEAVLIEDVLGNLPAVDDENADLNDYSLEYPTTPFGAKIWYVPSDSLTEGVIDWSRANEFLFETELIQHSDEEITIYSGQTLFVTPVSIIDAGLLEGEYSGIANIARLA